MTQTLEQQVQENKFRAAANFIGNPSRFEELYWDCPGLFGAREMKTCQYCKKTYSLDVIHRDIENFRLDSEGHLLSCPHCKSFQAEGVSLGELHNTAKKLGCSFDKIEEFARFLIEMKNDMGIK